MHIINVRLPKKDIALDAREIESKMLQGMSIYSCLDKRTTAAKVLRSTINKLARVWVILPRVSEVEYNEDYYKGLNSIVSAHSNNLMKVN